MAAPVRAGGEHGGVAQMSCAEPMRPGLWLSALPPTPARATSGSWRLRPHTWPGTGQGETGVCLRRLGSGDWAWRLGPGDWAWRLGPGDWAWRLGLETGPGDWDWPGGHRPAEGTSWGTAMRKFLALGLAAGM